MLPASIACDPARFSSDFSSDQIPWIRSSRFIFIVDPLDSFIDGAIMDEWYYKLEQPISIISFGVGYEKIFNEWALSQQDDVSMQVFDLRRIMCKDPIASCSHYENGTFQHTQSVVIGADGFGGAVMDGVWSAASGYSIIAYRCTAGAHRSDVCSRSLQSMLNYIECAGGDGSAVRRVNAQYWALQSARNPQEAKRMIEDAHRWCTNPWTMMQGGWAPPSHMYGHAAAAQSEKAMDAFSKILNAVDESWPREITEDDVDEPSRKRLRLVAAEEEEPTTPHDETTMPHWATFDRSDPSCWWQFLKGDMGADESSLQSLYCLSQHSDDGWCEANNIVSKVVKKVNDREVIVNISAFIHKCCVSALHELLPRRHLQKPTSGGSWT